MPALRIKPAAVFTATPQWLDATATVSPAIGRKAEYEQDSPQ